MLAGKGTRPKGDFAANASSRWSGGVALDEMTLQESRNDSRE